MTPERYFSGSPMGRSAEIGTTVEPESSGVPAKRRVILLVALAAVGLVAAIVVVLVLVTRSSGGEGPLIAEGDPIGEAQPAAVGQAISVSGPIVLNPSDRALVLDRVELVGLQRGVYRGAYVLPWPPSKTTFSAALTYRVPRDGRVMPGVTVAPHTKTWIVIGLTAKRGQHQWTRIDIVYHDGSATYRRHAPIAGAVCGSAKKYKTPCDIPGLK
jgi:hypothetical protein